MTPLPPLNFADPDLAHALNVVQTGGYAAAHHPRLNAQEKAIIYYYTHSNDCARAIKHPIDQAKGVVAAPEGLWLQAALARLPAHSGTVHSAEYLPPAALLQLQQRQAQGGPLGRMVWPNFLSSSTAEPVAVKHFYNNATRKNCLLHIESRTGRYIDAVSRYGTNGLSSDPPEDEVLFLPNTSFRVVAIRPRTRYTEIQLIEL